MHLAQFEFDVVDASETDVQGILGRNNLRVARQVWHSFDTAESFSLLPRGGPEKGPL